MNERNPTPFCHLFRDEGIWLAYDVGSNEVLEVEPALAAVLPLHGAAGIDEVCARLAGDFPAGEVRRALAAVTAAQENQGLFRSARPQLVPPDPGLAACGECDTGLQHLVLSVTDRCNLRCGYCLHGADLPGVRRHGDRVMSRDTALGALTYFLDRCDPQRRPAVSFYGGEPLLARELIEEVMQTARRHPRGQEAVFAVDTNGILLHREARELAVRERLQVQISLDGPQAVHDRHRRRPDGSGSFTEILANVEALLALDRTAADRLRFVITLAPPVDLAAVDAFFADFPPFVKAGIARQPSVQVNEADLRGRPWATGSRDPASFRVQWLLARDRYLAAVGGCRRADLGPVIKGLFEPDLRRLHDRPRIPLSETFVPGAVCRPGRRKLHVTVAGRYQPCERTGEAADLGSVSEGIGADRVKEIQDGFHRAIVAGCRECWALRLCRVCFAHQGLCRSATDSLPAKVCPGIRLSVEENLKLLARVLKMDRSCREFLAPG